MTKQKLNAWKNLFVFFSPDFALIFTFDPDTPLCRNIFSICSRKQTKLLALNRISELVIAWLCIRTSLLPNSERSTTGIECVYDKIEKVAKLLSKKKERLEGANFPSFSLLYFAFDHAFHHLGRKYIITATFHTLLINEAVALLPLEALCTKRRSRVAVKVP